MRIHHIINSYSLSEGGAERLVRRLHTGLRGHGIKSSVLGLVQQEDDDTPYMQTLGLKNPYQWQALTGIRRYVLDQVEDGDIVHAHLFPTIFYLSILKQLGVLKCKLICTEHSTSNRRRDKFYGKFIDWITYAGFDKVIAISEGAKDELLAWKPGLHEKTIMIWNGANLSFDHFTFRQKTAKPVIVSVGRLVEAKNYPVALKALALLDDVEFEFLIAGKGEGLSKLKLMKAELLLDEKVHFLGHVNNIKGLLEQADIFLIPSVREGFGLAAVEAMNAGLPIIASDIPGLREVVSYDPQCAILVDPGKPESIAQALRVLLGSYQKRITFGTAAFEHSKMFSEEIMVESYLKAYTDMLGVDA